MFPKGLLTGGAKKSYYFANIFGFTPLLLPLLACGRLPGAKIEGCGPPLGFTDGGCFLSSFGGSGFFAS